MSWHCRECKTPAPPSVRGGRPMFSCPKCSAVAWEWAKYPSGLEGLRDLPGQPPMGGRTLPGGLEGLRDLPGWKDY
jgi:hypothetical protein